MSQRHDSIIKVLVVGSHRSGKTSLIARLTANNLPETYRPTVEQCSSTMTTLPGSYTGLNELPGPSKHAKKVYLGN